MQDAGVDPHRPPAAYPAASSFTPVPFRKPGAADWCRRHDSLVVTILLVIASAIAYPDAFFRGEAIAPADLIFSFRPWNVHVPPDVVAPSNPVLSDQVDMFIPEVEYVRQCLRRGEIPFWCDKILNGTPFYLVIKHELMVLPLVLCILLFKVPLGMNLYFILRHVAGGFFFYRYTRLFELNRWACLCGSIVFCYGKYAVQDFIFPMYLEMMLLPILAYGTERIIRDKSIAWLAVLPLLLVMNMLSGFPAGSAYCFYFLAIYTAFRILCQSGQRLQLASRFAVVYLLTLFLAAPALAATADFFSGFDWSYRQNYWAWRMPTEGLVAWLFPFFQGSPDQSGAVGGSWYEYKLYMGVLPLFVVIIGAVKFRGSAVRVFYLLFTAWLIVLLYDVGGILEHVVKYLPILNSNPNTRQKLLLNFVAAVLVAFSLDDLTRHARSIRLRRIGTMLVIPLLAYAAWRAYTRWKATAPDSFVHQHLLIQSGIIVLSALVFVLLRTRQGLPPWIKWTVALLLFVDLQTMDKSWYPLARRERTSDPAPETRKVDARIAVGWNPTIPRTAFYLRTPGIQFIKDHIGPLKTFALDTTFLANAPLFYDVANIGGRGFFDARIKKLYSLIDFDAFKEHPTQHLFRTSSRTRLGSPVIDALGIKYVVIDSSAKIPHLSRDYLIKQPEWNDSASLGAGQSLVQTFRVPREGEIDRCEIRLTQNLLTNPTACQLSLRDLSTGATFEAQVTEWNQTTNALEHSFPAVTLKPDRDYELRLTIPQHQAGTLSVLCTTGADLIRTGRLTVRGRPHDGDLTFSLFAQSGANLEKYKVVYDDDFCVLENRNVYGRAWLAGGLQYGSLDDVLSALKNETRDLRNQIWVEEDMRSIAGSPRPPALVHGSVQPLELLSSRQKFAVDADRDCFLVVSDNYNRGWRARIDGEATGVFRADCNLRAIVLPKGRHIVAFDYRPPYFLAAVTASVLSAIAYALYLIVLARRRRTNRAVIH